MAKLGSKENPLVLNVHDEETFEKLTKLCHDNDWYFYASMDQSRPEDLNDLRKKLIPYTIEKEVKMGRNEPCPCGSGKKLKKCCIERICPDCGTLHLEDEFDDHLESPRNSPLFFNP